MVAPSSLSVAVLIVAAGRGARMGQDLPKQYLSIGGRSVLARAVEAFASHPLIATIGVVLHPEDHDRCREALAGVPDQVRQGIVTCDGGETRQASVLAGLEALSASGFGPDALVLIHDAARPFVSEALTTRAIGAGLTHGAAIPVLPVTDTTIAVGPDGALVGTLDRGSLRGVQTPQVFRFGAILAAHRDAAARGDASFTDDAGLIRAAGGSVATFAGEASAFKITVPEDIARAEALVAPALADIRSATGYDVHIFGPGDHIMLGGVRIPHDHGVVGHSDADVLLHALTDALLGCIADGDIGVHFPPSDMRWKGAASEVFLAEAVRRVRARGGVIRHLDGTVVCEAPKVGPHRDAIRAKIAAIAAIDVSRVSLKATTSEKVGFTGRREGLAALATATIALPS